MSHLTPASHTYRTVEVPVRGGALHVGVWDPVDVDADTAPTVLAIHGITASHLAWLFIIEHLPGVRVIAPDLRGRGKSNTVTGSAGMNAHAQDLSALIDHFGLTSVPVMGHSMGGFVAVTLAHHAPEKVERLLLVDGGFPLDAPVGVSPEALVAAILGPTAERLSRRFASPEAYLDFWRLHPAFQEWSAPLEEYFRYDLVPVGKEFKPATSVEVTTEDTIDLNTGTALFAALEALDAFPGQVELITVPRGLQNETPGLYAPAFLEKLLSTYQSVRHVYFDDFNHYTVVMSDAGAARIAELVRAAPTK